jgi:hypothetical protein
MISTTLSKTAFMAIAVNLVGMPIIQYSRQKIDKLKFLALFLTQTEDPL